MVRDRRPDESKADRTYRRTLIASRFKATETNHRHLKEAMRRHYPVREAFVEDWTSDGFDPEERLAALERFYERIVNSLNQIVDLTEAALAEQGKAEHPPAGPTGDVPGRWRRLQLYGAIGDGQVEPLKRLAGRRNIFQKEYPDLGPEAASDIYDDAREFVRLIPKIIPAIRKWVDEAIPARPGGAS